MSDSEFLDDIEENENVSESHSKLLEAVSQLDKGQRVKKAERSEPTLEVSEFHLVKSGVSDSNVVHVKDLAKALGKKSHHHEIVKNLESARKKVNVLEKPLEKPAADRIKRVVGFQNTKKELKKWNAIITTNRTAESIRFPLNQPSMKLEPTKEFVKRFRIQSDLEKALASLEPQKENVEEKDDDFSLTMNEIIMKRKEAAKIRAQQSYREAKSRRERKIKSKKFHRVQRKEKIKLQLKEFEELKKTNPEAALEKLEQLDKTRAEERMSLRHKNTGKWAQSKQIRAKYDKDTRQELAQQLSVGRELTQKLKKVDDSEEEDGDDSLPVQPSATDAGNPWVQKTESEIDNFVKSYRKFWDKENNQLPSQHSKVINNTESENKELKISAENPDVAKTFDESTESPVNGKYKRLEDKRTSTDTKSLETQSVKELTSENKSKIAKSKNANKTDESKKMTRTIVLDDDKKLNNTVKLQKKDLKKAAATSMWNVESVEEDHIQQEFSSSSNISNKEKINKIFNTMEDKIQDQIKSKLQHITENYNQMPKKRKLKDCNAQEEDSFDGLEIQTVNKRLVIDSSLHEGVDENDMESNTDLENAKNIAYSNSLSVIKPNTNGVNKSEKEIDPSKYINVKAKHLHTDLPSDITGGDDVLDDSENEDERHNVISEAFADDDIVEEFRREKEEKVKASQPEDIDLTLPGWGRWGGKNIKPSKRKTKRFIVKFPKEIPRKDENKGDVIIFEDDKAKIKQHQVSELPYPFTSVKDYEASVRMPIGRNFVPEIAHKKLIEPIVKTSMGKIIEPMTEDILVNTDKKKPQKFIAKKRSKIIKKKKIK
ncbi:U3 small nucleolar RNA-associated protein 14 homolog A [Halictus rubicundus]|uniref:U3 small nucleolar RNA-associated protein 14 homolog A n=1 Tax=Halictus rubicundus TaxID=77578 RepID=UPI004036CEB0